jgi:transcriptional regulator with XRE-family HTH domain
MITTFSETMKGKKTFGERLRLTRTKKGYTQEMLADAIGYTRVCLNLWENGHGYPNAKAVADIADVLDCSVDRLLGRQVEPGTLKPEKRRTFGEVLKEKRKARGYKQYQIAALRGCDVSTWQHWEKEHNYPSILVAIELADFFGCSLDELLGRRVKE